jgi:hypothetical protein
MANQRRPFTAKPRIDKTSQTISSVIISPIPEAYAKPGADGAVGLLAARLIEHRSAYKYVNVVSHRRISPRSRASGQGVPQRTR